MKVLFDYEIFLTQRHGGISRYFTELIRQLAGQPDLQPVVVAGLYRNDLLASLRGLPGLRLVGWHLPRWLPGRRIYSLINQLLFAYLAPRLRPDVYHATYYKTLVPHLQAPRVVTVYDMIHELFPGPDAARDPTPQRKRRAVQRADAVICISEHTRLDLVRLLGVPTAKTQVIPLAGSLRSPARAQPPSRKPYLLYVGDRGGYKNAGLALRVLAGSPELKKHFHLVYFGGPAFTADEQRQLGEQGLAEQVHHVTGNDEDLATWYAHAFAFIYPSRYEGFGMPPLEAMQFGCPVLASDRSSLPEVVGQGGLLLDPDHAEAWAEVLVAWLRDPAQRNRFVESGSVWQRSFTWDACAKKTADAYRTLMKSKVHREPGH